MKMANLLISLLGACLIMAGYTNPVLGIEIGINPNNPINSSFMPANNGGYLSPVTKKVHDNFKSIPSVSLLPDIFLQPAGTSLHNSITKKVVEYERAEWAYRELAWKEEVYEKHNTNDAVFAQDMANFSKDFVIYDGEFAKIYDEHGYKDEAENHRQSAQNYEKKAIEHEKEVNYYNGETEKHSENAVEFEKIADICESRVEEYNQYARNINNAEWTTNEYGEKISNPIEMGGCEVVIIDDGTKTGRYVVTWPEGEKTFDDPDKTVEYVGYVNSGIPGMED